MSPGTHLLHQGYGDPAGRVVFTTVQESPAEEFMIFLLKSEANQIVLPYCIYCIALLKNNEKQLLFNDFAMSEVSDKKQQETISWRGRRDSRHESQMHQNGPDV